MELGNLQNKTFTVDKNQESTWQKQVGIIHEMINKGKKEGDKWFRDYKTVATALAPHKRMGNVYYIIKTAEGLRTPERWLSKTLFPKKKDE